MKNFIKLIVICVGIGCYSAPSLAVLTLTSECKKLNGVPAHIMKWSVLEHIVYFSGTGIITSSATRRFGNPPISKQDYFTIRLNPQKEVMHLLDDNPGPPPSGTYDIIGISDMFYLQFCPVVDVIDHDGDICDGVAVI